MRLYRLPKVAVMITEPGLDLIARISSNPLDKPENALLDFAGRIVVAFDQLRIGENQLLIAVHQDYYFAMIQFLSKHLKMSKARLELTKYRVYFDLDSGNPAGLAIPLKHGQVIFSEEELQPNVPEDEFRLFRLRNNIPAHGIDYTNEMVLNVSPELATAAGCYPGQEVVARVTAYSKPPRKLVVVSEDAVPEPERNKMTSVAKHPSSGKSIGFLFVPNT